MRAIFILIAMASSFGVVVADEIKPKAVTGAVAGAGVRQIIEEQEAVARQKQLEETLEKLKGTEWRLVRMGGKESAKDVRTTLRLDANGTATGMAGVNRYNGPFKLENGSLKAGPFITTLMGGEPAAMKQESEFMAALSTPQGLRLEEGKLVILSACGCGCDGGCKEDDCKKCGEDCGCKEGCKTKVDLVFEPVDSK